MIFSDLPFLLYFLPIILLLYYTAGAAGMGLRNLLLLAASFLFYAWGEPYFVLLLLLVCVLSWVEALWIGRGGKGRKRVLICSLVLDAGILLLFKYAEPVILAVNHFAGRGLIPDPEIPFPMGISFILFSAISYLTDVYRGAAEAQKNPLKVSLYISFFPKLLAGPALRFASVEKQLAQHRHTWELFSAGVCRFASGMAKKLLLADVFAVAADTIWSLTETGHDLIQVPVLLAWTGAFAFMLQIFFDLSSYFDMACGLGMMFGFTFEPEFEAPYCAGSVSEFWRRWYRSLIGWFHDYIFEPLGGARSANKDKMVRNLLFLWLAAGLWHGLSVNFLIWGLLQFACILMETLFQVDQMKSHAVPRHIYTLLILVFSWVTFRSGNVYLLREYFGNLFGQNGGGFFSWEAWMLLREYAVFWIAGILLCLPWRSRLSARLEGRERLSALLHALYPAALLGVFAVSLCFLARNGCRPFLYFSF